MNPSFGQTMKEWIYERWLELRLGWLAIKKARLEYALLKLKRRSLTRWIE